MGGVAGDAGPERVVAVVRHQVPAHTLDGPHRTVLGRVLQDDGERAVGHPAGGVGVTDGGADGLGHPLGRCGDRRAGDLALGHVDERHSHGPQVAACRRDACVERHTEVRLGEQAGVGVGQHRALAQGRGDRVGLGLADGGLELQDPRPLLVEHLAGGGQLGGRLLVRLLDLWVDLLDRRAARHGQDPGGQRQQSRHQTERGGVGDHRRNPEGCTEDPGHERGLTCRHRGTHRPQCAGVEGFSRRVRQRPARGVRRPRRRWSTSW